jgi:membrane protease YdiL (CAAX protease family)
MAEVDRARTEALLFLAITFTLTAPLHLLMIKAGGIEASGALLVFALMWCPGVAAVATRLVLYRSLRGLGWGWGRPRYPALAYVLPLVAGLVAYSFAWATGLGALRVDGLPKRAVVVSTLVVLVDCIFAMGEELGWRGLLVPALARLTSYTKTSVLSGVVWAVWHWPLILLADYNNGQSVWYSLACFTLLLVASSFAYAWLRLRSGSLWTAVILHGSWNAFIQSFFDKSTEPTALTPYVLGEFGIALPVVLGLFALLFWRRRSELPRGDA